MDARLDRTFESWGGFAETADSSSWIRGRLHYEPGEGIYLELTDNPKQDEFFKAQSDVSLPVIYGTLADGTPVTLADCFVSKGSIQIGIGIGSPTTIFVNRALFGHHLADVDQVRIKRYSTELTSLAHWTCASVIKHQLKEENGKVMGMDVACSAPDIIKVNLAKEDFDVEVSHGCAVFEA